MPGSPGRDLLLLLRFLIVMARVRPSVFLGYTVKPWEELDYPLIHVAVANGDASFMANHWNPHHAELQPALLELYQRSEFR